MHREKLNILLLLLLLMVITGSCRSTRISESRVSKESPEINAAWFLRSVESRNIFSGALIINRITVNYNSGGERHRFRANLKYDGENAVLISIRTFAGIEAARIFMDADSVKIIDRLNKIYYRGKTRELEEKYGLPLGNIGLLFGDFIYKGARGKKECIEGYVTREIADRNGIMKYTFDCSEKKLAEVEGIVAAGGAFINGSFGNYRQENGLIFPATIEWQGGRIDAQLQMEMRNLREPDNVSLIFRPGEDYTVRDII